MRNRSGTEARALAVVLLLSVVGLVRGAPAQTGRVERGAELYAAGKPLEAAAEWEKGLAELGEAGWKIHYNLGLAYEAADRPTQAVEHYDAFLHRVAGEAAALPPELEERREDAAARVSAIKAAHGAIVLPPQATAVMARIDAEPPRRVGYTAYVKPGKHRVAIVAPGGAERGQEIDVGQGASLRVDTSDPTPRPPPPRPLPPPIERPAVEEPEFPTVVVLVGAGLTILSFAAPIALWNVAADKRNEANALGVGHSGYPEARDDFVDARTVYLASYAIPAGLGAITLGVAVWGWIHISRGPTPVRAAITPSGLSLDIRF